MKKIKLTKEEIAEIKEVIKEEGKTEVTIFINKETKERELTFSCFNYENATSLAGVSYDKIEDYDDLMNQLEEVFIKEELYK